VVTAKQELSEDYTQSVMYSLVK